MPAEQSSVRSVLPGLLMLLAAGTYRLIVAPLAVEEQQVLQLVGAPLQLPSVLRVGPLFARLVEYLLRLCPEPLWLRLLALAAGLLSMVMAQPVARRLGGIHATPGALLLCGGAPLLVLQASALNSGTLMLASLLLWLLCFLEAARSGDGRWLAAWAGSALLALGTHPIGLCLLAVQWLAALGYRHRFRLRAVIWWPLQIVPVAAALVVYGPVLAAQYGDWAAALSPARLLQLLDGSRSLCTAGVPRAGVVCLVALCLPALAGLWACRDWRRNTGHGMLLACALAPTGLWALGQRPAGYLLLPLLCLCVLAAMGLRTLPRWLRQLCWSAMGATYLVSYWFVLP